MPKTLKPLISTLFSYFFMAKRGEGYPHFRQAFFGKIIFCSGGVKIKITNNPQKIDKRYTFIWVSMQKKYKKIVCFWLLRRRSHSKFINFPSRWSIIGFFSWSSSWWWIPHLGSSFFLETFVTALLVVFDQFFAKYKFCTYMRRAWKQFRPLSECFRTQNCPLVSGRGGHFSRIGGHSSILEK